MQGDLELLPARLADRVRPELGAVTAEQLGRVRAKLRVIGELGEREQVLISAC